MKDIKTEKGKKINKKSLIVALDVAQEKHVVYIRCPDGRGEKPFVVFNRREEYEQMWERISQTKEAYGLEEVVVGFESTGPYAEPLVHYLMKKEVKLVQVNPMHTKRVKEIRGNSPNKTDEKDPEVIADIIELGYERLEETLRKITRGRMGKERAEALYEAAVNTVGVKEGQGSIVFEIKQLMTGIEETERFIDEMEERMKEHLKEIPYSRCMLSIQGVGEVTVGGLIGEVGDFTKYRTIAEITKLAGLDLFEVSSGKHKGERHISKRGRPLMRKLLFYAAINVVREGRIMHERYERYLQRGMPRIKALIAIARKLLGILFALARDQRNYEEIPLKEAA